MTDTPQLSVSLSDTRWVSSSSLSRPSSLSLQSSATKGRSVMFVSSCWVIGLLTGLVPVMTGLYTTEDHLTTALTRPQECTFKVNKIFSIIAPVISFFFPAVMMVFCYVRSVHFHNINSSFINRNRNRNPDN